MKRLAIILAIAATLPSASAWATSPQAALEAAWRDARQLDGQLGPRTRYLSLYHFTPAERAEAMKALNYQANALSHSPERVPLKAIGVDLIRVTLDDYEWDAAVWEKMIVEPWFHALVEVDQPYGYADARGKWVTTEVKREKSRAQAPWLDQRMAQELVAITQSQVPIVRADWWFIQTARQLNLSNKETGFGYYDWHGFKDRAAFEKITQKRLRSAEVRAIVDDSGVAAHNRQVVQFEGNWLTLDTDDDTGTGNAIRNPRKGDYKHKAEEHFAFLPNELFAVFLCDDKGNRQAKAPDFIGSDTTSTSNDRAIHVGLSCWRCHVEGLRPIDDWARRNERALELQFADLKTSIEIRRQYLSDLKKAVERDRAVYAAALKEVNGLSPEDNAKVYAAAWQRWADRPRDLDQAARELGTSAEVLRAVLLKTPSIDPVLAGLLTGPLKVTQWEEVAPQAFLLVKGIRP